MSTNVRPTKRHDESRESNPLAGLALVFFATLVMVASSGCQGCDGGKKPPAPTANESAANGKVAGSETSDKGAAAAAVATPPKAAEKPPYRGPSSKSADGYQLTMGFADNNGTPQRQPEAMEATQFFVTALDPTNRPLGQLADVNGRQLSGFLVARDLRQLLYSEASAAIADGADARRLVFAPREGGDHALIAAFATDRTSLRVVTSPVVVKGALPQLKGPGVAGLSDVAKFPNGSVALTASHTTVGAPMVLTLQVRNLSGAAIPVERNRLTPVLVADDAMGQGWWLAHSTKSPHSWTFSADAPGDYLVLAVLRQVDAATSTSLPPRPLAFKLTVKPATPTKAE